MMETNGLAMHESETKIKNKISRKGEKILSCIAVCDFPWAKVKLAAYQGYVSRNGVLFPLKQISPLEHLREHPPKLLKHNFLKV